MIIFNWIGLAIFAVSFGVAFGIGSLLGHTSEGAMMILAGPIAAALDLAHRYQKGNRQWFQGAAGGSLFFIPIWCLGLVWLALGISYLAKG